MLFSIFHFFFFFFSYLRTVKLGFSITCIWSKILLQFMLLFAYLGLKGKFWTAWNGMVSHCCEETLKHRDRFHVQNILSIRKKETGELDWMARNVSPRNAASCRLFCFLSIVLWKLEMTILFLPSFVFFFT